MTADGGPLLCLLAMVEYAVPQPRAGEAANPDGDDPCAGPRDRRAPIPRCGEPLDGRAPPANVSPVLHAARAVTWVPRTALMAVLWPAARTSAFVEGHHLGAWAHVLSTTDDDKVGIRPVVNYNTRFLPTGGLRVFYRRLPGVGSEISASFQTAGPAAMLGDLWLRGPSSWGLSGRLQAGRRADRMFAGLGPNSMADLALRGQGVARFAVTDLSAALHWFHRLVGPLWLGLHGDVLRRDYRAGNVRGGPSIATLFPSPTTACTGSGSTDNACVDPEQAPGFQTGLRLVRAGAGLGWDGRNRDRDGSGVSVRVDATFARGWAGDRSRHVTLGGEIVAALGGVDRAFVLRARAASVHALGSAPVPFEELVSPAGAAGMRGYPAGRFRGPIGAVGTAEYRWFLASRIDASLFADVGTVSRRASLPDLRAVRWFPDVGIGLRFYNGRGPHWIWRPFGGVQLAYAPGEGAAVLFSLAPF
jgi:hypothetical protein